MFSSIRPFQSASLCLIYRRSIAAAIPNYDTVSGTPIGPTGRLYGGYARIGFRNSLQDQPTNPCNSAQPCASSQSAVHAEQLSKSPSQAPFYIQRGVPVPFPAMYVAAPMPFYMQSAAESGAPATAQEAVEMPDSNVSTSSSESTGESDNDTVVVSAANQPNTSYQSPCSRFCPNPCSNPCQSRSCCCC